ncbi:hypothetical protein FW789_15950 [Pseudomonas sp. 1121_17]
MARCEPLLAFDLRAWGAALQPFRDTRPLLQKPPTSCKSSLVSRKGRKAPPKSLPHTNSARRSSLFRYA